MKRFPCEETTIDFRHGAYRVRLWVTNEGGASSADEPLRQILGVLRDFPPVSGPKACLAICEAIACSAVFNLAAVQVIHEDGQDGVKVGHMIYTVPFD